MNAHKQRDRQQPEPTPIRHADGEPSSYADDPMTKLWRNAQDRETGAEAVAAIRARRKNLGPQGTSKKHS